MAQSRESLPQEMCASLKCSRRRNLVVLQKLPGRRGPKRNLVSRTDREDRLRLRCLSHFFFNIFLQTRKKWRRQDPSTTCAAVAARNQIRKGPLQRTNSANRTRRHLPVRGCANREMYGHAKHRGRTALHFARRPIQWRTPANDVTALRSTFDRSASRPTPAGIRRTRC